MENYEGKIFYYPLAERYLRISIAAIYLLKNWLASHTAKESFCYKHVQFMKHL